MVCEKTDEKQKRSEISRGAQGSVCAELWRPCIQRDGVARYRARIGWTRRFQDGPGCVGRPGRLPEDIRVQCIEPNLLFHWREGAPVGRWPKIVSRSVGTFSITPRADTARNASRFCGDTSWRVGHLRSEDAKRNNSPIVDLQLPAETHYFRATITGRDKANLRNRSRVDLQRIRIISKRNVNVLAARTKASTKRL